jgi:hypothetical protein
MFRTKLRSASPLRVPAAVVFLLAMGSIAFGCVGIGGAGDLQAWRSLTRGRYDQLVNVSSALDLLIARPAPNTLTPQERIAWDQQTQWLVRTKSRLFSFAGNLKVLLDKPQPSGSNEIDRALATAQLVGDYSRLGDEFVGLMSSVTKEAEEDEKRIAAATAAAPRDTSRSTRDSLARDSLRGGMAYSSPLKTRHDDATTSLSSLT